MLPAAFGPRNSRANRTQRFCSSRTSARRNSSHRMKPMAREKVIGPNGGDDERKKQDAALRPKLLKEVIGQRKVAERLEIAVKASKKLNEPLGHILFDGPPGLGKTTFATVLPNELGTSIQMTSGPALTKPADLLPFLTNLEEGSVKFIACHGWWKSSFTRQWKTSALISSWARD